MRKKNGCSLLAGPVDPSLTFFPRSSHHRSHPWMFQTNSSLNASNLCQRIEWAPVMRRRYDTYWHLKSWVILTPLQATEWLHSTLLCPRQDTFDNFQSFDIFTNLCATKNRLKSSARSDHSRSSTMSLPGWITWLARTELNETVQIKVIIIWATAMITIYSFIIDKEGCEIQYQNTDTCTYSQVSNQSRDISP